MSEKTEVEQVKPVATWLGVAKLEIETRLILGSDLVLPKILWKLCCISFICGYSDAHTYLTRGVFSTMMTGNFVIVIVAANSNEKHTVRKIFLVIISYVLVGATLNMFIIRYFKSWEGAYNATLILFLLGSILCQALDKVYDNETIDLTLYIYTGVIGNVCYWTTKTGLLVFLHTGNMMKTMEFIFKFFVGFNIGDNKAKGDVFSVVVLEISFAVGAVCAAFINNSFPRWLKLTPVIGILLMMLIKENWHFAQSYMRCVQQPLLNDRNKTISTSDNL